MNHSPKGKTGDGVEEETLSTTYAQGAGGIGPCGRSGSYGVVVVVCASFLWTRVAV